MRAGHGNLQRNGIASWQGRTLGPNDPILTAYVRQRTRRRLSPRSPRPRVGEFMKLTSFLPITLLIVTISLAGEQSEMQSKLKEAQQKFSTTAGHDYAEKFATSVAAKPLIDAMHECDKPTFLWSLSHDVVFIVATDGHVEQVFQSPTSPFGDCVAAYLQAAKTVPKPPGDHWPVQIHLLNGPREKSKPDQPYVTF